MSVKYFVRDITYDSEDQKGAVASVATNLSGGDAEILLGNYLKERGDKLVRIIYNLRTKKTSKIEGITFDTGHEPEGNCVLEGLFAHP